MCRHQNICYKTCEKSLFIYYCFQIIDKDFLLYQRNRKGNNNIKDRENE